MDKEPIAILVDIVKNYMSLPNNQVWQFNQEIDMANNRNLFVVIHYLSSIPLSSSSSFEVVDTVGRETISSMSKEIYSIEIGSFDRSAISRKEEILQALKGGYSQNQQAEYGFRIFPLPVTFNNVSRKVGPNMLNRFMIDVALMVTRSTTKNIDYYTDFPYQLTPNA